MFFASSSLKRYLYKCCLIAIEWCPSRYHYATPKVLLQVNCPPSSSPSQTPPSRSLFRLVKTHTKLPILAAYLYLTVIYISVARCEIRICSIGSLVSALTKGQVTGRGHLTGDRWRGTLDRGKWPTFGMA